MELFSEHFQKEHILSKVDVRVKLVVLIALLIMVLSYKGMLFPMLITAGCFIFCLNIGIPSKVLFLRMAPPLFVAMVILLLKFFFTGDNPLFSVGVFGLKIIGHRDGLAEGLKIATRILGSVSLLVVCGFATPFTEIMAGLSWLRISKQFIEIMIFAYRYIFVFLEDGMIIYNAQKNRLGYSGIKKGMKSFGTLTGSLVMRGFDQSHKIVEVMAQRGYSGDIPLLKASPLRATEIIIASLFVIFAGAVWLI